MKTATFNANSIRSRLPIILSWLKENKPDYLCIQETKVQDKDFPIHEFEDSGYNVYYKGEKSYNGVAILSKKRADEIVIGFDKKTEIEGSRIITAYYDDVIIVNTYIPQGQDVDSEKYAYKLNWFDQLLNYFENNFSPDNPILWMGDFNVAFENKDVHDPKRLLGHVCFNPVVQNKLRSLINFGFTDILRKFHPEECIYSFWDYRVADAINRGIGWRIDYIMATKPLADKFSNAEVDIKPRLLNKPSDHTFVTAEIIGF